MLALCRAQHTPGWLQQHGYHLPKQLITLIDQENKAVAISDFEAIVVPGLLQTGEYARALISRSGNVPVGEVEDRVAARLARRVLFSQERPARFTFFVHEFVLRTPVGGPATMSDQLHHLLQMSVRSYLTLRVVPASLGAHAAMAEAFRLMEFAEFRPVAYLESTMASLFLELPAEIATYRSILAALAATALSAPEPHGIAWHKSSYSAEGGNCVEVAPAPHHVLVHDSKDPDGPALAVPTSAWRTFLTTVTH